MAEKFKKRYDNFETFFEDFKSYRGNALLKRAGVKIVWTEDLIQEYLKCSKDPIYFIEKYCKIVNVDYGLVPFTLRDYQREIINSLHNNRRTIVCASRQSGKTTSFCGYLCWYILFNTHVTAAILANRADTARELLARLQFTYMNLPHFLQQGVVEMNKSSIDVENGSRVIADATNSDSVRGYTINFLVLDETAYIENWENFSASVLPTISSGKTTKICQISCVTDNTYIFTSNGLQQLKDLIDYNQIEHPKLGYTTTPYQVLGKDKLRSGNILVNSGEAETKTIITPHSSLTGSYEHKLWSCCNGEYKWEKLSNLKENDYIAIQYGMNIWGNNDTLEDFNDVLRKNERTNNIFHSPKIMNNDLSYFLGLFLAEGYARILDNGSSGQVTITCGDDILHTLNETTNLTWTKERDNIHYRVCSTSLCRFLKHIGFDFTKKAKEKIIPNKILQMSKENVAAFISGMFDGDGCSEANKMRISYASASEKMIDQLRMLLLNFGILTTKHYQHVKPTNKSKVWSDVWYLEISIEESYNRFYKEIGFKLERKQNNEKQTKTRYKGNYTDIIPFSKTLLEKNNIKFNKNGLHKKYQHFTRKSLLHLSNQLPDIISSTIIWEKIKTIETGYNKVYDFSLPDIIEDQWCHSVIYNGIIGHQTPNGLNHFFKTWTGALSKTNDYYPIEVHWSQVPGRDEAWKKTVLADLNFDNEKFEQEYCVFGDTLITLKDTETNKIITIPIKEAYDLIR